MAKYVYICGPVTGLDYEDAKGTFDHAAEQIRRRHGLAVEVVNPMDFCQKGEEWDFAMRKCIVRLMECHYIHLLPGWERSRGARLEFLIAEGMQFGLCNDEYNLVDYAPART